MTILKGVVTRVVARPLVLAQMFTSAASALTMVMAAAAMSPDRFTTYSLLTLATLLCTGATRSLLFQPALIEARNSEGAHIHVRVALLGALAASTSFLATVAVLGIHQIAWLVLLSTGNILPVMAEWLRLRAMTLDARWLLVRGDALRLLSAFFGVGVLWFSREPELFCLFVSTTYATTLIYLAARLPAVHTHLSPLKFWRPASSQLADFVMSQAVSTIPLLLLGGLGSSSYIGGIRMAQTLTGPVNLVIQASAMNLMADGATRSSHTEARDLIRHGRRLAKLLSLFCLALVSFLLIALYVTGFSFRGVDSKSLIVGVSLVGLFASATAWYYPDAIVMRLLGHHTAVTAARASVITVTAVAYTVGYLVGGVDGSLVLAFICSAAAHPLAFVVPASLLYRRYRGPG